MHLLATKTYQPYYKNTFRVFKRAKTIPYKLTPVVIGRQVSRINSFELECLKKAPPSAAPSSSAAKKGATPAPPLPQSAPEEDELYEDPEEQTVRLDHAIDNIISCIS